MSTSTAVVLIVIDLLAITVGTFLLCKGLGTDTGIGIGLLVFYNKAIAQ